MGRTSRFIATCFAAAILAWQPSAAHATEDETQLWMMFDASIPLDQQTDMKLLVMPRFRDSRYGQDVLILRGEFDHDLTDNVSIGGGLTYVAGPNSFRPFQQVEVSHSGFAVRFRLEEITGTGDNQLGLRERVQLRYKLNLDHDTSATLAGEWIDSVRSENSNSLPALDQWRGVVSIKHDFTEHFHAGLGYTIIVAPTRDGSPTKIIHAPLLSAGWNF
jgi:hypothetical protein